MRSRARPPVWLWLNLLSLDAPLIALIWQDFLSRCFHTALRPTGRIALCLTVWAIYLADRLLDTRAPATAVETTRHKFYRQHRALARILFGLVLLADSLVAGVWLRRDIFNSGLLLAAAVAVYLGVFPLIGWSVSEWKKPPAALLFTAGTFLIAWTSARHPLVQLAWPAAAFCALCLGNLSMIERWDRQPSPAAPLFTRGWVVLIFLFAWVAWMQSPGWFGAIILSAAGLCVLSRWGQMLSGDARCVLADAVLLSPLLFQSAGAGMSIASLFRSAHTGLSVARLFP